MTTDYPDGLIPVDPTEDITVTVPKAFGDWLRSAYGLTPAQVLTAFVHDLRGTTASNGSDERRLAEDWFDRVIWPVSAQDEEDGTV